MEPLGTVASTLTTNITYSRPPVEGVELCNYIFSKSQSCPTTRHEGAWGGGEISFLLIRDLGTR
jgi:hypothetical protein